MVLVFKVDVVENCGLALGEWSGDSVCVCGWWWWEKERAKLCSTHPSLGGADARTILIGCLRLEVLVACRSTLQTSFATAGRDTPRDPLVSRTKCLGTDIKIVQRPLHVDTK